MSEKKSIQMRGELWALIAFFAFTASNLFDKLGLSSGANPFAALIVKDSLIFLTSVFMSLKLGLYKKCFSKSSPDYCGFRAPGPSSSAVPSWMVSVLPSSMWLFLLAAW